MIVLDGGLVAAPVPIWIMAGTLVLQLAAIAFNVAIALTPGRAPFARNELSMSLSPQSTQSAQGA